MPRGPVAKALRLNFESLKLDNGVLCRVWKDPAPGSRVIQTVVPRANRSMVLRAEHGAADSGHFGVSKVLRQLRQQFYWLGCCNDVELFMHCCYICTTKKGLPGPAPSYAVRGTVGEGGHECSGSFHGLFHKELKLICS